MLEIQTTDIDGNPVTIGYDDYRLYVDGECLVEFKHSNVKGAGEIIGGLLRDAASCQAIRDN